MTLSHRPTGAAEFLALDLSNAFVCEAARAGAAGTAGLDGVGAQVVCKPLQITVTNKWVLGQVTGRQRDRGEDWKEWRNVREVDEEREERARHKHTHEN